MATPASSNSGIAKAITVGVVEPLRIGRSEMDGMANPPKIKAKIKAKSRRALLARCRWPNCCNQVRSLKCG
jgi:hypothetical protein